MGKKLFIISSIILVSLIVVLFFTALPVSISKENISSDNEPFLGANLPDRCEFFDQVSSRSSKGSVKSASGKLFSYRIASNATNLRYFQFHNLGTVPSTSASVVYAVPLDTTTASATPKIIEEVFAVPMDFSTGIAFTISGAFATWSSVSQDSRDSYFVTMCYN